MNKRRLAILRCRTDVTVAKISDQACSEMLVSNANRTAVLQYWSDNLSNYLDFSESKMFDWVDVTMSPYDGKNRQASALLAYNATAAAGNDLSAYDGFLILMLPGRGLEPNPNAGQAGQPPVMQYDFDGGSNVLSATDTRPISVFPVMTCDHTFMCHEVGHTLGFHHTYGLLNNGIDWDTSDTNYDESNVYGDPYDIMSSATYGSRWENPTEIHYQGSPTFVGQPIPGWPNTDAFSMGPAPARAHIHHWDDEAILPSSVKYFRLPLEGTSISIRLHRASGAAPNAPNLIRPTLLIIEPQDVGPQGQRRIYVEFRDSRGWDKGLHTIGDDLSRQAVVVHAISDTPDDGARCWYRGRILIPLEADGDLQVPDLPILVRVNDVAPDLDWVEIGISSSSEHELRINQLITDTVVSVANEQHHDTPCGTLYSGTYLLERTSTFTALTYGYGGFGSPDVVSPQITWSVNGVTVGVGLSIINVSSNGKSINIEADFDQSSGRLRLRSNSTDGAYAVVVNCTATEVGGLSPSSSEDEFEPVGSYTGLRKDSMIMAQICIAKLIRIVRLLPRDLLIPTGPDPFREDVMVKMINLGRIEIAAKLLEVTNAQQAGELRFLGRSLYGMQGPARA